MLTIRRATIDDVEVLTHMSRQFHNFAPHAAMINATDTELEAAIHALMEDDPHAPREGIRTLHGRARNLYISQSGICKLLLMSCFVCK